MNFSKVYDERVLAVIYIKLGRVCSEKWVCFFTS